MTCIVGYVDANKTVWMGGDSAGVSGLNITLRKDTKVFRNGEFLIGFTTSFRMGQILHHDFIPPSIPPNADLEHYMVKDFTKAVRDAFKQGGFAAKDKDVEEGGTFLVGVRGRLFTIASDYQVGESHSPFDACGCGVYYATGALSILTDSSICGKSKRFIGSEIVERALVTAATFSCGVHAPFVIEELPLLEPTTVKKLKKIRKST